MNRSYHWQSRELNRLVSAAIVNKTFCDLLLADPSQALSEGFRGEGFNLSPEERQMIASIEAKSLLDFAQQLVECRNGVLTRNGNGHGNSNGHWPNNGHHK